MGLKKRIPVPDFVLSALSARIVSFEKKELVFQKSTEKHLMGLVLEGLVYLCVENEAFERHILQMHSTYGGPIYSRKSNKPEPNFHGMHIAKNLCR